MQQTKQKEIKTEIKILNLVLLGLAGLSFLVALMTAFNDGLRAGTDDLFLILTCLLLALLFAVPSLMWAKSSGLLDELFKIEDEAEAGAHAHEEEHAHGGSNKQNMGIWFWLLALTAVEVFLAYIHIPIILMLIILILLSLLKAAMIVAYFMHLKFERMSLVLTIVPTLIVLFCLFAILFPDGNRLRHLRGNEPAVQHVESSEEGGAER